jgi:hypothetical protein
MAEAAKSEKRMPKGGRKGGTRFPQVNLQKALEYAKKLVSKTHNGPQPEQTILVGVFNTKGSDGKVRASALKQYGLMEGDTTEGYVASQLARDIVAAVPEERSRLIQRAFFAPKLFKQIYDTLQPDTVGRARVRQVVITANVHPESADKCVTCFVDGAIYAGLASMDGENIALTHAGTIAAFSPAAADDQYIEDSDKLVEETGPEHEAEEDATSQAESVGGVQQHRKRAELPAADVRVNLAVDSSSDPDKLEKQLKLLKQYGLLR